MKAVQSGNTFRIYDNSMKTYDKLPAQSYLVNFDNQTGFYLTLYSDINVNEKTYGVHEEKVQKALNAFYNFDRNLGIILSGDKGIGKSLFSKMLAKKAIEEGFPLIIVNCYIPGIAEYLNSIEQQVMILFDEFDKVFDKNHSNDPQAEMLTLFDGIAQGKKLFVVTCNKIDNLNNYLVNRPGRFHYHFRFDYPEESDITEYLQDALHKEYYKEISNVVAFSKRVRLNYDCLRAIAFELNCGNTFEEAIKDLNIVNVEKELFNITLQFTDGSQLKTKLKLDLFNTEKISIDMYDSTNDYAGMVTIIPADNVYNPNLGACVIEANNIKWTRPPLLFDDDNEELSSIPSSNNKYEEAEPSQLIFRRIYSKDIHYIV